VSDLAFVDRVRTLLAADGVPTWLFAGWAEELHGTIPPRPHKDVDLLVRGDGFDAVDAALAARGLAAERLPFKRAFVLDGVEIELILVRADGDGLHTDFPEGRFDWPADLFAEPGIASREALRRYRAARAVG
jgi:hypothetical protein